MEGACGDDDAEDGGKSGAREGDDEGEGEDETEEVGGVVAEGGVDFAKGDGAFGGELRQGGKTPGERGFGCCRLLFQGLVRKVFLRVEGKEKAAVFFDGGLSETRANAASVFVF